MAAKIIASPDRKTTVPASPTSQAWPATSSAIAAKCGQPSRSWRSGTARIATHTTSVFWMNAAWVASARERPSKKRTNGTLPPMTAIASNPSRCLRMLGQLAVRGPPSSGAANASSRTPATAFFAVV